MEFLHGFYELTNDMVYIFDWLYANIFSLTLGDTITNWMNGLPQEVIDFVVGFFEFYGLADLTWVAFLFGSGLVFVIIWKVVGFLVKVIP